MQRRRQKRAGRREAGEAGPAAEHFCSIRIRIMKQWRAEKAKKEGVPVFIIATNKELSQVVNKSPTTVEALRQISGFGKNIHGLNSHNK